MRTLVVVELALPIICLLAVMRPSVQDSKASGDSPCTGKPCSNGAECIEVGKSFTCRCQKGFGGKQCQDIHMCAFKPCNHGATCTETKDAYRCLCPWGFSGTKCEMKLTCDSSPCQNGGTCKQNKGGEISCDCKEGFTGRLCEEPIGTMAGVKQLCGDTICHRNERCDMTETKVATKFTCVCRPGASCTIQGQAQGPIVSLGVNATLLLLGVCSGSIVFVILLFTLFGALYNMKYAPLTEVDMEKGEAQRKSGYTSELGSESSPETGAESGVETGAESGADTGPDTGLEAGAEGGGESGDACHKTNKGRKSKDKGDGHEKSNHGKDKGHSKDKGHGKDKGHKGKSHGDKKHKHK